MYAGRQIGSLILAIVLSAASTPGRAAGPQFESSGLPPPATDEVQAPSLYVVFQTGDTSPLGKAASSIKAADLIDEAASYIKGNKEHPANPNEAAFWLKRAILMAPDESGRRRAWAVNNLGLLVYNSGDAAGHTTARYLWEMAGAWNSPEALCNLGQLAEFGDDVAKPDSKKATEWYERARRAGCLQAAQALSRLPH